MPREKRPEDMVGVRLDISDDVRRRLIVAAAKRDQSMAACLRQVVTEWVNRVEPSVPKEPKARKTKEQAE